MRAKPEKVVAVPERTAADLGPGKHRLLTKSTQLGRKTLVHARPRREIAYLRYKNKEAP